MHLKPVLLTCVVLASAGAGVAIGIWPAPLDAPKDARAVPKVAVASPSEHEPADTRVSSAPHATKEAVAAPKGFEELETACPYLVGTLTDECESALDRRFASEAYRRLPLLSEVTGGQVFALAESTLANVEAALSRSECQVPPGRFRPDLRERCAAHDMTMLALLHRECSRWIDADPDGGKQSEVEAMLEEARWDVEPKRGGWLDEGNYLRIRRNNAHMAYARAWTYHKCQPLRPVLKWRGLELGHVRDISAGPPTPFDVHGWHVRWLSNPLLEAAARVGSEFAFMRLLRVEGQLKREPMASMFAELEAHNPTLAQAKLASLPRRGAELLAHAMAAQMLAPLQGVEAQWPWRWTEDGRWLGSWGSASSIDAAERRRATAEAKRIVARIAGQRGWDATALDWSKVAAPMDLPAERD